MTAVAGTCSFDPVEGGCWREPGHDGDHYVLLARRVRPHGHHIDFAPEPGGECEVVWAARVVPA